MGVLVFAMAVLPMTDGRAMHLMRAENPADLRKNFQQASDSAKILYAIYFVMTRHSRRFCSARAVCRCSTRSFMRSARRARAASATRR